jgi:hypothetical protein
MIAAVLVVAWATGRLAEERTGRVDPRLCAKKLATTQCYLEGVQLAPGETPAPTPPYNSFSKTLGVNLEREKVRLGTLSTFLGVFDSMFSYRILGAFNA